MNASAVTPAMESGVTDHIWTIQELLVQIIGCAAFSNDFLACSILGSSSS